MTSVFCMAAGKGTRLAPWTLALPKPALPVANQPALSHILRLVARSGYRNVTANASWLADVLIGMIGDGDAFGVSLAWSVEDEPLGTAGGVLAAQDKLRDGDEPILVLSGDGLHNVDLVAFERAHRDTGALVSIAALPVENPSQYGVLVHDASNRVGSFQEKPAPGTERSKLANTGIYLVQPEVLDSCAKWGLTDFGSELFPRMLEERQHINVHSVEGSYWNDIGSLDEWRNSNFAAIDGTIEPLADVSEHDALWGDEVLVHPSAKLGSNVSIEGPCVIGPNAVIEDEVQLRSAVVLPGATVTSGTIVASGTIGSLEGLRSWAASLTV